MTELYIIRHGQTAANVAGLKQGTIDDERTYLSETGIAQAKELAGALDLTGFAALCTGRLKRRRLLTKRPTCQWSPTTACSKFPTAIGTAS